MAMIHCRECGKKISDSATACSHCGAKQKQTSGAGRKVNWTVTLVMSVVFGYLGVDRFIMGHVGLGILKLLTLGGCGVWWLIDLILVATKYEFENIEWVTN